MTNARNLFVVAAVVTSCAITLVPGRAHAYPGYTANVPNGTTLSCLTCHNNASGGCGCAACTGYSSCGGAMAGGCPTHCWNPFGSDFGTT